MQAAGAQAYLVNTGWNGTGKRISIKDTRAIIDALDLLRQFDKEGAVSGNAHHQPGIILWALLRFP